MKFDGIISWGFLIGVGSGFGIVVNNEVDSVVGYKVVEVGEVVEL